MSLDIEIRGNDLFSESTASAVTLQGLGVMPYLIDESIRRNYMSGRLGALPRHRLAFQIELNDFEVAPNAAWQDSRTYFELAEILRKRYKWIHAIGSDFVRINDATFGLIAEGKFTFPILVEVMDWPDLNADFEHAANQLTGFTLLSVDRY